MRVYHIEGQRQSQQRDINGKKTGEWLTEDAVIQATVVAGTLELAIEKYKQYMRKEGRIKKDEEIQIYRVEDGDKIDCI